MQCADLVRRQLRVLMIEDSAIDATLIEWELKNAGYEIRSRRVETESELLAALEEAEEGAWDVVTCDYRLPGFNAARALELVRANGMDVPFIVISGAIGEDAAVEMMRAGAHDYLMKANLARLGPVIERELRDASDRAQRAQAEAVLKYQAFHDTLTGLPNRAHLRAELDRLTAPSEAGITPFALLILDLDRFKEVNDTLGHQAGDALLQQVGPLFRAKLGDGVEAVLARLGGDEFSVLLPGADASIAREVSESLLHALERPFQIDGSEVELGGSIGIALYPDHGADAEGLLRQADIAMYAAKEARSGCAVYEPGGDRHSLERLGMRADLRRAIDANEFVLHYQPQVDVHSGALVAVEALVRWQHPLRGFVAPDEFIPLAEQTRLIRPLSRWVLSEAMRQSALWREAGLDIPVAVNLSAHDLHDAALPQLVRELLDCCGGTPQDLRIEITESSLMGDPLRTRQVLTQLREMGVQIAIDDFGTGYSSLAYLKDLPVDELKIDASFVRDMTMDNGARAIVRAVIDLADDLGLRVVAEGIEDRATWQALAGLGCTVAQGYYFAPPLAATEVTRWAAGLVDWRLEEAERSRLESALADRTEERGARLAAEEQFIARKQAESAARDTQERLRLALDAAGMATYDADLVKGTRVWAGAVDALLGEQSGTLERDPELLLERVHADDRQVVRAAVAEVVRNNCRDVQVEFRLVRHDGVVRWVASSGRVFHDPAGRPVRILGTLIDVTERKLAEQQRQVLAQAEKLRALGQMASGVAHDLNQSLGLIAGYSEVAQRAIRRVPIDSEAREALIEALPIISEAAMDGGETVRRLLTFARTQPDGTVELVQLGALIRDVAQLTAPQWRDASQAAGRPIKLYVNAEGETAIEGWPIGLREALTNLVFNAVDALPDGGTIRVSARRVAEHVVLEVSDSGVGMSAEVQERIFEPFYTTKGERGTGLGLAQVFGVVEHHRGTVVVESRVGAGTTFRLTFPAASASLSSPSTEPIACAPARQLRVLAVDDEPNVGSMIRRILRHRGHSIVTATSGEEALERLKLAGGCFDVLISDMGMGPGMNGWELVERASAAWPDMRCVLATGWGAAIDQVDARTKGVDAVIAKPYRPADLERLLEQLCAPQSRPEAA